MHVLITGAGGFLGQRLAARLLEVGELKSDGHGSAPIESLTLVDRELPESLPSPGDGFLRFVKCDITDRAEVSRIFDRHPVSVFHLASVVSAQAEADPNLAFCANVDGTRNVLDAACREGHCPHFVATSTYAVLGGDLPAVCGNDTRPMPQSTYGMTKAVLELLVSDYSRRGQVDGRVARLPTVIIRPGPANAAASSVASALFREPLRGAPYEIPVALETRMAVSGVRTVVEGLLALHDVETERLGADRVVTFPSAAFSIEEMIASLERVCGPVRDSLLSVKEETTTQRIVTSWPTRVDAGRATQLGVPTPDPLDDIVRAYATGLGPATELRRSSSSRTAL